MPAWLGSFGHLVLVGVEGAGVYGAGLARYLREQGVAMVEIDRPDREARRWQGKSDPLDAQAAARAALARVCTGVPKHRDGRVEALRNLRVARRSAIARRVTAQRQVKALVVTAPERVHAQLRSLSTRELIITCAALRPARTRCDDPAVAARIALRSLARRHQHLTEEITDLDELIASLVAQINPALVQVQGVGTDVAGQLLVTAGDNPERMHSEAAFAMLCGVAPLSASSGKTQRHRLNHGGDRDANRALWRIAITRMATDPRTRDYAQRRTKQGKTKKEIIRCLKRYIAREIYSRLNPASTRKALAPTA